MSVQLTEGPDAGAVWHYGDPLREQRELVAGRAGIDFSHRPVFTVGGPDRLSWLNDITSQQFAGLAPGVPVIAFVLSAQGHLQHVFAGTDDGQTLWCHTEPGHDAALLDWLGRMVFAARVEVAPASGKAVVIPPGEAPLVVDANQVDAALGTNRAGIWAAEAVRIASGLPRVFVDTDERTIPNELANPDGEHLGPAVHLAKGCYPGQEAVARTYNLGRPPRRLTRLHLDGTANQLPPVGADVLADGVVVGRMGSSERHYELGPVGLALLKRTVAVDAPLEVAGVAAAQEILVNPEAGLHFRPGRG